MMGLEILAAKALNVGLYQAITILLISFAIFLILAGLFTAYFGSGKSRTIGVVLLVVGIVALLGSSFWYHSLYPGSVDITLTNVIWQAFLVLLMAVLGALAAIAVFLVAIMKS